MRCHVRLVGRDLPASAATLEGQALPEDFDRRVAETAVKTAESGIEVEDVREIAAEARQVVARFDGSVLSSRVEGDDDSVSADLLLAVPSPEFEGALDELRNLGKKVTTDAVRGEDVTEEFVDLESRERNLVAAEQSLLGLHERAGNVGGALSIERELTNIRGQIEQVQGRINRTRPRPPPGAPPASSPGPGTPRSPSCKPWGYRDLSAFVFAWWLVPALVVALACWRRRTRPSPPTPQAPAPEPKETATRSTGRRVPRPPAPVVPFAERRTAGLRLAPTYRTADHQERMKRFPAAIQALLESKIEASFRQNPSPGTAITPQAATHPCQTSRSPTSPT